MKICFKEKIKDKETPVKRNSFINVRKSFHQRKPEPSNVIMTLNYNKMGFNTLLSVLIYTSKQ